MSSAQAPLDQEREYARAWHAYLQRRGTTRFVALLFVTALALAIALLHHDSGPVMSVLAAGLLFVFATRCYVSVLRCPRCHGRFDPILWLHFRIEEQCIHCGLHLMDLELAARSEDARTLASTAIAQNRT